MMDDETMPAEARAHPRFRAMAKRNARALGDLIADRLSDTAAVLPHADPPARLAAHHRVWGATRRSARMPTRGGRRSSSGDAARIPLDAAGAGADAARAAAGGASGGGVRRRAACRVRRRCATSDDRRDRWPAPSRDHRSADVKRWQRLAGLATRIARRASGPSGATLDARASRGRRVDVAAQASRRRDDRAVSPPPVMRSSPAVRPALRRPDAGHDLGRPGERDHGQTRGLAGPRGRPPRDRRARARRPPRRRRPGSPPRPGARSRPS